MTVSLRCTPATESRNRLSQTVIGAKPRSRSRSSSSVIGRKTFARSSSERSSPPSPRSSFPPSRQAARNAIAPGRSSRSAYAMPTAFVRSNRTVRRSSASASPSGRQFSKKFETTAPTCLRPSGKAGESAKARGDASQSGVYASSQPDFEPALRSMRSATCEVPIHTSKARPSSEPVEAVFGIL